MNSKVSAHITLWCNRLLVVCVLFLLLFFPQLLNWYQCFRYLEPFVPTALSIGFYLCAPVTLYALWCIERLISNILRDEVFISGNVSFIRRIRWCCVWVSAICVPVACFYLPMIFMVVIMAFLALVVSVVKNVLAAAVEIRQENDLTI